MPAPEQRRSRAQLINAAIVFALAVGVVILYTFPPEQYTFYPRCPFYELTGLLCPGCGATRALAALTHANLAAAWHANAFLCCLLPLMFGYGLLAEYRASAGRLQPRMPTTIVYSCVAIALVFGIVRNV